MKLWRRAFACAACMKSAQGGARGLIKTRSCQARYISVGRRMRVAWTLHIATWSTDSFGISGFTLVAGSVTPAASGMLSDCARCCHLVHLRAPAHWIIGFLQIAAGMTDASPLGRRYGCNDRCIKGLRWRGREETSKKVQEEAQEEEAARQLVQDKKAMEQARREASKRAAAEEAQRLAEEKKSIEKKVKALKDAEEEKKRAKVAVKPFAFLDDTEKGSGDEDDEEETGARGRTDAGAGGARRRWRARSTRRTWPTRCWCMRRWGSSIPAGPTP